MRLIGDLLQRFPANEVMIELDERAIPQLVRRNVIVLDVVGVVTAAERTRAFVTFGRQPLAVRFHLVPGVHGRQRRGNPARFECIGRICPGAHQAHAIVFADLVDRSTNFLTFFIRAPDLESRRAGHTVAERADFPAGYVDRIHVEELDVRWWPAMQFLDHLPGIRTLDLVTVALANGRFAAEDSG